MRLPVPRSTVWVDGRRSLATDAAIPIDDPAFHAGLGVFETLAVRGGRVLDLSAHVERLREAAARLALPLDADEMLRQALLEAAADQPAPVAWLKITLTRGGRWYVYGGPMDPEEEGRSVSAVLLPWRRNPRDPLAGMKTLNYGASILGLEEAARRGAEEGIWLNTRGHLAEGCTSNLFLVQAGKIFTAAVRDGILPGVVRGLVLRAARDHGITVHRGKVRLKRLERADEAFLTSSLCGVRPLIRFNGRAVGRGEPGAVTARMASAVAGLRRFEPSSASLDDSTRRGRVPAEGS